MSRLAEALENATLPASERARERTVALAVARTQARVDESGHRKAWLRTSWPRFALVGAAAAAMVLSPPGKDVVSWAGDLVGIGDPPTVTERPSGLAPSGDQVVIGSGTTPDGARYEIVGYATNALSGEAGGQPCIFVDYPALNRPGGGACGALLERDQTVGVSGVHFPAGQATGSGNPVLDGFANPDVRRVSIRLIRNGSVIRQQAAAVAHLEGELQREVGAAYPATVFVAFLPRDLTLEPFAAGTITIEAVGFAADGSQIGRDVVTVNR